MKFKVGDKVKPNPHFDLDWEREELEIGDLYEISEAHDESSKRGPYYQLKGIHSSYPEEALEKGVEPEDPRYTIPEQKADVLKIELLEQGSQTMAVGFRHFNYQTAEPQEYHGQHIIKKNGKFYRLFYRGSVTVQKIEEMQNTREKK